MRVVAMVVVMLSLAQYRLPDPPECKGTDTTTCLTVNVVEDTSGDKTTLTPLANVVVYAGNSVMKTDARGTITLGVDKGRDVGIRAIAPIGYEADAGVVVMVKDAPVQVPIILKKR